MFRFCFFCLEIFLWSLIMLSVVCFFYFIFFSLKRKIFFSIFYTPIVFYLYFVSFIWLCNRFKSFNTSLLFDFLFLFYFHTINNKFFGLTYRTVLTFQNFKHLLLKLFQGSKNLCIPLVFCLNIPFLCCSLLEFFSLW